MCKLKSITFGYCETHKHIDNHQFTANSLKRAICVSCSFQSNFFSNDFIFIALHLLFKMYFKLSFFSSRAFSISCHTFERKIQTMQYKVLRMIAETRKPFKETNKIEFIRFNKMFHQHKGAYINSSYFFSFIIVPLFFIAIESTG